MHKIIFTDLDGTFLNHDDYSFDASEEARKKIFHQEIPLIFTTSKTKIEVELLQQKVGIDFPFITENGAAIFIPKKNTQITISALEEFDEHYYILQLGVSYKTVLAFYNTYKTEFGMFGFSDMTVEEAAKHTGLPIENAQLSKQRDFTEPFILEDETKLASLEKLAKAHQLKITKGGRFYHLIGENQDKGKAVAKCISLYEKSTNLKFTSIGLGDGDNDIPLLENVDIPIAIKNHQGNHLKTTSKNLEKSSFKGAKGWNEMILKHV